MYDKGWSDLRRAKMNEETSDIGDKNKVGKGEETKGRRETLAHLGVC